MQGLLAIYFLAFPTGEGQLEDRTGPWGGGSMEEQETEALVSFVRRAGQEIERRGGQTPPRLRAVAGCEAIRVTRSLRVYIGPRELKVRPMSKTVLLLFLRHPEGIPDWRLPERTGTALPPAELQRQPGDGEPAGPPDPGLLQQRAERKHLPRECRHFLPGGGRATAAILHRRPCRDPQIYSIGQGKSHLGMK